MSEETGQEKRPFGTDGCIGSYLLSEGLNEFELEGFNGRARSYDIRKRRLRLWNSDGKNPIPNGKRKIQICAEHGSYTSNYSVYFE